MMPNNVRTVVHKHHHITKGPGVGGQVASMFIGLTFSVVMMTLELVVWAIPVIVRGLVWITVNVVVPGVAALADATVRLATRAGTARRSSSQRQGGGWR